MQMRVHRKHRLHLHRVQVHTKSTRPLSATKTQRHELERLTRIISPDPDGIGEAAAILSSGGLVAFPTETVYGLGADARDGTAVAAIYEAKGRPNFNPLIVHVADIATARRYILWPDIAQRLASAFWPGPLSIVAPLRAGHGLSPLVTAGLPTVAIRVPAHPVARALLTAFGGPVAAPSANPSGKISPTRADHVRDGLEHRIDAIVDAGSCSVGLESTIVSVSEQGAVLLREGGVAAEEVEAVLETSLPRYGVGEVLNAPGQLLSHYAPGAPVRLGAETFGIDEVMLGFGDREGVLNLSPSGNLAEAASNLFEYLHRLDAMGKPIAVAPIPDRGLGRAINDRLRRAAAPRDT